MGPPEIEWDEQNIENPFLGLSLLPNSTETPTTRANYNDKRVHNVRLTGGQQNLY